MHVEQYKSDVCFIDFESKPKGFFFFGNWGLSYVSFNNFASEVYFPTIFIYFLQ